jgi:hypothetical protein
MTGAAAQRVVGNTEAAIAMYDRALTVDRRPEIYLQRGLAQLEARQRPRAIPDLITANLFYPNSFNDIPDAEAYHAVATLVAHREERIRSQLRVTRGLFGVSNSANLLANLAFANAGPLGAATSASGIGAVGPAAAEGWNVWNGANGTTLTELVPSTRRPGRKMLHVRTTAPNSGIWCFWLPAGSGPARVVTSAWIDVRGGRATAGSGNAGATMPDAASAPRSGWQLLEASNHDCPANATVIYSDAQGGADFFIDEIVVKPLPDSPCGSAADPQLVRARETLDTMNAVAVAVLLARIDRGAFPPSLDDVRRYEEAPATDGWGAPLRYQSTGASFTLASSGADARNPADDIVIENGAYTRWWSNAPP